MNTTYESKPWEIAAEQLRKRTGGLNVAFAEIIHVACKRYATQQTKELADARAEVETLKRIGQSIAEERDSLGMERNDMRREVERLKECLEPGKAPAIVNGLFREAERLGFYRPTAKHALTQFVEHVEQLRTQLASWRAALADLANAVETYHKWNSAHNYGIIYQKAKAALQVLAESAGPPPKT